MSNPDRFAGARLQESAFPDDRGTQDPAIAAALGAWRADPARGAGVVVALQAARLLVPVVAVADEVEYDEHGLAHDKSSDMAAVLLRGRDGRLALLAFTGLEQLSAWDAAARPVAVPGPLAAQAALQDGAAALVVDVGGPVTYAVTGEDLLALAGRWRAVELDGRPAWLRPAEDAVATGREQAAPQGG